MLQQTPLQEREEVGQRIADAQNAANDKIVNDKEALKGHNSKERSELLYKWSVIDVIPVMKNSLRNYSKPDAKGAIRAISSAVCHEQYTN